MKLSDATLLENVDKTDWEALNRDFQATASDAQRNLREFIEIMHKLERDPMFRLYCLWDSIREWFDNFFGQLGEWFEELCT